MNGLKYYSKKNNLFVEYFIEKEKNFLSRLNFEAYKDEMLNFYIGWFAYAINDYIEKKYDILERFKYFFLNNDSLDIKFYTYIMNAEFRNLVIRDIQIYKQKYRKDNIYE